MESYDVLRQAFKQAGCKRVAQELKLSLSLIHQWSRGQNGQSAAVNPLERVAQVVALTGDVRVVEYLCTRAGGKFVRGDKLHLLACREWEQMKREMEIILNLGAQSRPLKARSKAVGTPPCRHLQANGRCGLPGAAPAP